MLAAAEQNKAFNFSQMLYYNQGTENTGWLTDDDDRPDRSERPRHEGARPARARATRRP